MPRPITLYLYDILKSIELINEWLEDTSAEGFFDDNKLQNAIILELIKIGEAVKQIPKSIRKDYPDIPWKSIAGMRDNLVHEYFGIKLTLVWKTATTRLDELEEAIKSIQEKQPPTLFK